MTTDAYSETCSPPVLGLHAYMARKGTFAARVEALRKQKGWTQTELARRAGLDGQTVHRIEHGKIQGGWKSRSKLAEAFGITIAELVVDPSPQEVERESSAIDVTTLSETQVISWIVRLTKELERRRDPGNTAGPASPPPQSPPRPRRRR